MSEEAKEKAGSGKAAHRKKKGKKVWDRKHFLCLGVFRFAQLLLRLSERCFMCLYGKWEVPGWGEINGWGWWILWKVTEGVFDHVFYCFLIYLFSHLFWFWSFDFLALTYLKCSLYTWLFVCESYCQMFKHFCLSLTSQHVALTHGRNICLASPEALLKPIEMLSVCHQLLQSNWSVWLFCSGWLTGGAVVCKVEREYVYNGRQGDVLRCWGGGSRMHAPRRHLVCCQTPL